MKYESIKLGLLSMVDDMLSHTEKYLSSFGSNSQAIFGMSEEEIKKAHARYRRYTTTILSCIARADAFAAELSLLVCQADLEMDNEKTELYSLLLDEYCRWKSSVAEFMETNDILFANKKAGFKCSDLVAAAQKLYEASKFLRTKLI